MSTANRAGARRRWAGPAGRRFSRGSTPARTLADILDLPYGEADVPLSEVIEQHSTLVDNLSQMAGRFVEQLDEKDPLATKLEDHAFRCGRASTSSLSWPARGARRFWFGDHVAMVPAASSASSSPVMPSERLPGAPYHQTAQEVRGAVPRRAVAIASSLSAGQHVPAGDSVDV